MPYYDIGDLSEANWIGIRAANTLLIDNFRNGRGRYFSMIFEEPDGHVVEIDSKTRLKVRATYIDEKNDFSGLTIERWKENIRHGWRLDGSLNLSLANTAAICDFLEVLKSFEKFDVANQRISFGSVSANIARLASVNNADEIAAAIVQAPSLTSDVLALALRKDGLNWFKNALSEDHDEATWQRFFDKNRWIFGTALDVRVLDAAYENLEVTLQGASVFSSGDRVDGLMRTRAVVSQTVLVEIKRPDTALLAARPYRSGVWQLSQEVTGAVAQVRHYAHGLSTKHGRVEVKNIEGQRTGDEFYVIQPQCYVVAGCLSQLKQVDEKVAAFEIARRDFLHVQVITYDELFERARYLVELASRQVSIEPD